MENKDNVFTLIRKLSDPWFWLSEQRDPLLIMGREGGGGYKIGRGGGASQVLPREKRRKKKGTGVSAMLKGAQNQF